MIVRAGEVLVLPASLATPAELTAGVRDIEGLCLHIANEYLARRRAHLAPEDDAELVSYLMLAAWTEAARYQVGIGTLLGFLSARLRFRCTDWYRSRFGRSRAPRPVMVSLDSMRDQELEPDCA